MVDITHYFSQNYTDDTGTQDTPAPIPTPIARTPYEEEQSPSLEDHEHYLSNVFHNSIAGVHQLAGQLSSDPQLQKFHEQSAKYQRDEAGDSFDAMSPAGRDAASGWNKHWMHGALFGLEQQAPAVAAATLGELAAGPPGAAAGFGAVSGGDFANSAAGAIEQMSPEQKSKKFPEYDQLTKYMTEQDATNQIIHNNINTGTAIAGVAGAAAGAVPFVGGTLGRRMAAGFGAGAAQSAVTDLALGVTTGDTPNASDVVRRAGESGAIFGALSAAGGHRREKPLEGLPSSADHGKPLPGRGSLDSTAEGGQASSTGSPRQGRKSEAQLKPPGSGRTDGTGQAPPSDPMDTAQREALETTLKSNVNTSTPPKEGEIQPPVAQPAPPIRSPSVPDMSGQGPETRPIAESPPAATPAPANALPEAPPPSTAAVPERPETLQLQFEALKNSQKEAVFYPQGEGVVGIPKKGPIRQLTFKNGDVIQYRTDGNNKLNAAKVHKAYSEGKLNDILGLGPVSREEAVARSSAGEQPVAVVNRAADGTEESAAAGTTATAPTQIAALEQTQLTPESTTTVESPQQVIADRQAPASEIKQDIRGILPKQPGKKSPQEKQARLNNHDIANRVYGTYGEGHPDDVRAIDPNMEGGKGARTRLLARVKAAVEQANQEGFKFPGGFRKNVDPTMDHPMASLWLSEARTLSNRYAKEGTDAIKRFLRREEMLKKGDMEGVLQDRINEAREKKEPTHEVKEEAIGETTPGVSTHEVAETAETDEEEAYQAAHDERERAAEEARIAARRAESEELRKQQVTPREQPKFVVEHKITQERKAEIKAAAATKLAELRAQLKAKKGESVSALITPKEKTEATKEEELGSTVETHDLAGKPVKAQYLAQTTTGKILNAVDIGIYSKSMRPLMDRLVERFKAIVPDVPVYLMSDNEMNSMKAGKFPVEQSYGGGYNRAENHTLLNAELPEATVTHVIMHETFHAATIHALSSDPHLADLNTRLYNEVKSAIGTGWIPEKMKYGLTSPVEFITEVMSNPVWQTALRDLKISPELAKDLDMPRWRKATLFQGALDLFRKILGLSPREYNVIEAALNIGERAMWEREPADEYGFRLRASQVRAEDLRDSPISAMISPRNYSGELKDVQNKVVDGLDKIKSGFGDIVREQGKRFLPMMDMVYGNEKYFGAQREDNPLRQLGNETLKMEGQRVEIKKQSDPLLRRVMEATRNIPYEMNDLHQLLQKADHYNVHPDDPLGVGHNKHIRVDPKKDVWDNAKDNWEAIAHHAELAKEYNNLSPTGKELFRGIRDMLTSIHKDTIQTARDNVFSAAKEELDRSANPNGAELKAALQKVYDGQELDKEEQDKFGKDPVITSMRAAGTMLRRQGFYFPAKRFGKYVVTGTHDYDVPKTGVRDKKDPNRIIFASRKDAFNFTRSLDLPSTRETKYFYTKSDGTKNYVAHDEAHVTQGAPQEEHHVIVNPKHVEFMDSTYEGEKITKALRESGVKDVTNPVLREQNQYLDYSLHSGQVDAFEKALDHMQHVTPGVRSAAKEAVNYMAIASMQGNRLNKNFLRKNRVAGADSDILRTLDSYRSSAATFQAGQEHLPVINKLLDGVRDAADDARIKNYDGAKDMASTVQEMERRLLGFKQGGYQNISKGFFHNVAALALFKYLFSPAHFALHLMHPVITSIPEMASKHGWWETYRAMGQVYKDMGAGETMLMGGKEAWQKAWDFTKEPTDFIDSLRSRLSEAGHGTSTTSMLKELEQEGYLTHMGLDFSPFYRKAGGLTYLADRSLSIMQELNNSAESINRVGTAVTAFELAKKKGMSDVEATGYAKQVLSQTHGLYANINRAPMMISHPIVRSMLQFKTFPMMIYRILGRNLYNIYKNDTPGVRWQAIKALTGMIGTAALFTGAQGATPEPIRLGITMTNLMGLTDSWQQQEDKLRRTLAENISPEVAGTVMGGLGHVIGWDLHHRLGLNDLTVFSEPRTTNPQDVENWFTNAILGVPWGMGIDAYTGYQDLTNGDYGKAANLLMPKALADLNKVYQLGTEGKTTPRGNVLVPDVGKMGLLGQALGFVPSQVTEAQQARAAYGEELTAQKTEQQHIVQQWHTGDKSGAIRAMQQYNRIHPEAPLRLPQIKSQQSILGYPVSPKNRTELEQRAHDYGIQ